MLSSESEVRCEERWAQLSSLRDTLAAARLRVTQITTTLGLQPRKVCAMVACPVDPEHRVKEENLPRHASACHWRQQGYLVDDVPLPGERGDVGLVISNEDARCIIQKELCKNPRLKTGPAAVGGLTEGCEAGTWQRITVDFTPDERRTIYDHVVAVTAPQRVPPPPELAFSGPRPAPRHGSMDDPVGDSLVAKLAAERDARRRRVSQKKVSTNRKSHLEVLREVIGNQMQLYSEWLSDETADPSASLDRPDKHHDSTNVGEVSSEARHGQRPSEAVDRRANDQVRNREYDRNQGGSDHRRDNTSGRFNEARHGVRFREDGERLAARDRDWEAKDGYRERDGTRGDNQRHRDSFGGLENKDRHRTRDRSWEAKDRYRERDGARGDRYRERDIGRGDKNRHRDRAGEFRESGKEYVKRRADGSRNTLSLGDDKGVYSKSDRSREDKRLTEDNDRSRDRDCERERADDRLEDQEVGYRDSYGRREREESPERVEQGFENSADAIVKQEQESDEEVAGRELDFVFDLRVKAERVGDDEVRQGKRKRSKEYDWSDDSEKESKKKNKKKKKKKHKKHKKKKVRSSSESESS